MATTVDSSWICATELQLNDVSGSIDTLQCKLNALEEKMVFMSNIIESSNDSISNQLSAATLWLEIIAIIIAIVGGVVGFYINRKKHQVEAMAKVIDEKKEIVDKMAKDTEELDKKIHENLSALYKDLRKEETNALLDRLVLEPKDISNLIRILFARELESDAYLKLKEAFLKFKGEGLNDVELVGYEQSYMCLFFQHFSYKSLQDDDIRQMLVKYFTYVCNAAFKRDIIISTREICKALSDEASTFNKEDVLVGFLKAINASKHKTLEEVKNILEQNIIPQSLLQNAIKRCKDDNVYLQLFGIMPPEGEEEMI